MNRDLDRRLDRLEADTSSTRQVFVWKDFGQSDEEAIGKRFPKGRPENVEITFVSWREPAEEVVQAN